MKYLIKNTFFIILTCLLFSVTLSACTKKQLKTIVIEEKKVDKNTVVLNQENNSFKTNKIYNYNSNTIENGKFIRRFLLGWFDNENIAGLVYTGENNEVVLNRINYKYKFTNQMMKINGPNIDLSPDGNKLVYRDKEKPLKIFIKDLNTNASKLICDINSNESLTLKWSNNSKYFSFSIYSSNTDTHIVYIYDVNNNVLKKIPLIGCKYDSFPEITISDDGKSTLIIAYESRNKYSKDYFSMYLFEVDSDTFDTSKNIKLRTIETNSVEFINSNKILFIDTSTKVLNIYDIYSKKIIVLDNNVEYFKLSSDSKNIAYVKYSSQEGSNIYACKINGDKISNKELVYKGFLPVRMYWSQDNKKILINGETYSDINMDYNQMSNNIIENPFNTKNLIIEFD